MADFKGKEGLGLPDWVPEIWPKFCLQALGGHYCALLFCCHTTYTRWHNCPVHNICSHYHFLVVMCSIAYLHTFALQPCRVSIVIHMLQNHVGSFVCDFELDLKITSVSKNNFQISSGWRYFILTIQSAIVSDKWPGWLRPMLDHQNQLQMNQGRGRSRRKKSRRRRERGTELLRWRYHFMLPIPNVFAQVNLNLKSLLFYDDDDLSHK